VGARMSLQWQVLTEKTGAGGDQMKGQKSEEERVKDVEKVLENDL